MYDLAEPPEEKSRPRGAERIGGPHEGEHDKRRDGGASTLELEALAPVESWTQRLLMVLLALALLAGFWTLTRQFWVPAHGGGDQNGYLVGGRKIVEGWSPGFAPADDQAFVGRMWVEGKGERVFPKYPCGFPLIVAGVLKGAHASGHSAEGTVWAYWVSPAMMTAALFGVFFLGRAVAGSFGGVLAMLVVGTSPVTLALANNPNSHAAALCFGTWGMYALVRWWQRGTVWRAALAGLLLGYAATIRYTEGLLAAPLVLVALFHVRWTRAKSLMQALALFGAWLIPVAALLAFNYAVMGTYTGYGVSGESRFGEAFKWEHFRQNWETMLRQLNGAGLFGVLSIGVLGLMLLWAL